MRLIEWRKHAYHLFVKTTHETRRNRPYHAATIYFSHYNLSVPQHAENAFIRFIGLFGGSLRIDATWDARVTNSKLETATNLRVRSTIAAIESHRYQHANTHITIFVKIIPQWQAQTSRTECCVHGIISGRSCCFTLLSKMVPCERPDWLNGLNDRESVANPSKRPSTTLIGCMVVPKIKNFKFVVMNVISDRSNPIHSECNNCHSRVTHKYTEVVSDQSDRSFFSFFSSVQKELDATNGPSNKQSIRSRSVNRISSISTNVVFFLPISWRFRPSHVCDNWKSKKTYKRRMEKHTHTRSHFG